MKSARDPRHVRRVHTMQGLFQYSFTTSSGEYGFSKEILSSLPEIDQIIQTSAPEWPLAKLNRVDLAILRLAIYELRLDANPQKVIIDEAIELAKEFGSEHSARFINGALGAALKLIKPQNETS